MSRRMIIVVGVAAGLAMVLAAGFAVTTLLRGRPERPPPMDPETAAATTRFLDAEGLPLAALGGLARPLFGSGKTGPVQRGDCESVAAAIYERFKDVRFTDLALQVPDPVLARLMLAEQAALFNGLAACGDGTMTDAGTQFELARTRSDLAADRMQSIGR